MLLPHRYPTLAVLSTAQALYWSCSIIGITLTGLVGQQLAPWPLLATLPLALLVTGSLLTVGPMARWMARHGPRQGLQRGALLGVAGGLVCTASIHWHSFVLLNLGVLLVGAYQASAGYYRFAALEGVDPAHKGRAAAWVVAGGIAAALLAPTLALHSRHLLATPLAGAYLVLALLAATAWAVLQAMPVSRTPPPSAAPVAAVATQTTASVMEHAAITTRRTLWQRPAIRQALLLTACAHGLMILVMNATPLAMHGHGHGLEASAHVIQWHVLGMFVPSLWAGAALDRWGARRVAGLGVALLAASAFCALTGESQSQYLASSLLLGAGWNLLLLAGTTLLTQAYRPEERSVAQPMMEWSNSAVAASMSLASGVLVQSLGWQAVNWAMLPVLCAMAWWLRPGALAMPAPLRTP
ncbi:MFS transporter [Comamonas sp. 17RB]|uniref:MFS transporter n=1 Tax=Comamonas sp. 17RB TaxID=3047025 RepID=UPI0024B807E4|nr:MFS transporter [Comamonas sp. 17RB]MDI9854867.1 MFS transporter [Comamonas sp. 17RB]